MFTTHYWEWLTTHIWKISFILVYDCFTTVIPDESRLLVGHASHIYQVHG